LLESVAGVLSTLGWTWEKASDGRIANRHSSFFSMNFTYDPSKT